MKKLKKLEVKLMEVKKLNAKIITNKGSINIKLFPEVAPFTVLNFAHLSMIGYYDNLTFHRVIDEFMIQGGDPEGNGTGGPGYQFHDEFKKEVVFDRPGLLAMANAGPSTNGSQFFITHVETPWLNYKHTIFGEVVSPADQDIVNRICQEDVIKSIQITGDIKELYSSDEAKETVAQINEILMSQNKFKNLRYESINNL
ncbi:peptidylprolyl isomerase [Fusobacteriaceae bacterium]|uniref:peptidylprolyl isomerase n=2 Tax=Fusobacterium TaxID=848 RepID=UPI0015A6AD61|nr:peptidylprolyl isomerase [Fusobacterium perfoetens]